MAKIIVIYSFMFFLLVNFTMPTATETDSCCFEFTKDSVIYPYDYPNPYVECWHSYQDGISLSERGLKGQFPPRFENCPTVVYLNLSHNSLQGPIPSDICKRLPYITSLDLSFNNFSGEIPASIANCSYLSDVRLNNNQLIGHIPPQIGQLSRIRFFNVSNNLLWGQVPNFFVNGTVSNNSYANNQGLCGGPLQNCSIQGSKFNWKFDYSFKSGFVIGYVVCATSVVAVFTSYCVPWVYVGKKNKKITILEMMMKRKHKKREDDQAGSSPTAEFLGEGTKEILSIFNQAYRGEGQRISFHLISALEKVVTRMTFIDLSNATENFSPSNIIGLGLMGTMYKATLPNGWSLAVKRMHDSRHFDERMVSELKTLGRLRHNNLLPLLGFCIESKERLLVYRYISNGNLFDWLHSVEAQKKILGWPLRLKIAVGVARGLSWLHHGCNARVVHLNISSRCILLDRNFEPKLSNFGEAMLEILTSTSPVNSDFWEMAFVKEDVHGYGVLLLELITGVDTSRMTDFSNSILNEWISHLLISSNFYDAIDKSLIGQRFDSEICQLLEVACKCVDIIPNQRPTMLQVYKDIRAIRDRCGLIGDSEITNAA